MSGPMNALHRRESTLYTFQHLIFQYLRSVKINNTSHRLETCLHTENHVHHHRRNAWSYACKILGGKPSFHVQSRRLGWLLWLGVDQLGGNIVRLRRRGS